MLSKALQKPSFVFYTLHDKIRNPIINGSTIGSPFVVHIFNPDDQPKTTLVSMLRKSDTLTLAQCLEVHPERIVNHKTFSYQHLNQIKTLAEIPIKPVKRTEENMTRYDIKRWRQEDLMEYCIDHWLDLMIIENLNPDGAIQVVEFEVPPEYIVERLNNSLR